MEQAATPTGPALTQPGHPVRTYQVRRSDDEVLQVWRVIANSGPLGISPFQVRERMKHLEEHVVKAHLRELRRKGHIRLEDGVRQHGMWVATAKLPLRQPAPVWMTDTDQRQEEAATLINGAPKQGAGEATVQAARSVPNSVFKLGEAAPTAFGVDIDGAHMPAQHKQALADAVPPAPPAASAPAADPAPADRQPIDPASELDATEEAAGPLFALYSDKTLGMVLARDRQVVLDQDETRALFAFLDSLMAIGHGSLSEAAS